jgi:hypothetical protein
MKSLALRQAPDMVRPTRNASAPAVLAQRRSTLGSGGSVTAPPIHDAGRPLDTATRGAMESGFGREFAHVRVHDDARAHDNARDLGARAYAAGDHIVFGEGSYRPETTSGRALIAHELAHSVQQGGVQMKADGPLPASADAELERQADRAALDVTAGRRASGLSSINRPAVFRADGDKSAPAADATVTTPAAVTPAPAGTAIGLPNGVSVIEEIPPGTGATRLFAELPVLELPKPKGVGDWVEKVYRAAATGKSLIFQPALKGGKVAAATKEQSGESYKDVWLNNYGFTSLKALGNAFATSQNADVQAKYNVPAIKTIITEFQKESLLGAKCDIDHVIEKQLGGGSISSNLQLLVADKNRPAGQKTYEYLVAEAEKIIATRPNLASLSMRFADVKVQPDASDPSFEIETLLRNKFVQGTEAVRKAGEGTLVSLVAGGKQQVSRVRATGSTPVEDSARRLVSGLKLLNYVRAQKGKGDDTIEAEIASKPLLPGVTDKNKAIVLSASVTTAPAVNDGAAGAAAADREAVAKKDDAGQAAGEYRAIKLDKDKNKNVAFLFPYLSPGRFTSLTLDDKGGITGTGVITPSVKFLGDLTVNFGPDKLDLVQDIDTNAINSSAVMKPMASMFRFTEGKVSIDLVKFKPDGNLKFTLGPKDKPVIVGNVNATAEGGAFVVTGTLTPGGKVPGISSAKGEVSYRTSTGWSGLLTATTSSIPNSTGTVKLGFKEEKGAFHAYGEGSFSTKVKNPDDLKLNVGWRGGAVSYSGSVTIDKPMPLVKSVTLKGNYAADLLEVEGDAAIQWRKIDSIMHVAYRRKDGEDGKFSGKADVDILVGKAVGKLSLKFDEAGNYSGSGTIKYPVTKDITPTLGLELKDRKVKATGEVAVNDIELSKKWPSPQGGKLTFIKGVGITFDIPTPIPAVTVFGRLSASAGLSYSVGPVMLTGLNFKGEAYPLEDDPQIKAHLTGKLSVPARADIYGTFGASIGARVALGLVSAEGGVEVTPSLGITGEGAIKIDADYLAGAFTFEAEAYAKGQMNAALSVNLVATLSGAWGLFSYTWNYPAWSLKKQIGPELKLTLGKIAYGKDGEITWPSLSQIKLEPENIDPMEVIKDLVSSKSAAKN